MQINWDYIKQNYDETVEGEIAGINEVNGGTRITYASEPHCACCLLVDTSGSMSGEKIQQLNQALQNFKSSVMEDPLSRRRVDVCVISFSTKAEVVSPFCPISEFQPPVLTANGRTNMAAGIRYALEAVHAQVRKYQEIGIECYKPFVLMVTDGYPTDINTQSDIDGLARLISDRENKGHYGRLRFFAFGVQGADLAFMCQLTNRVVAVRYNSFDNFFNWASESMKVISHSRTEDDVVPIPPDKEDEMKTVIPPKYNKGTPGVPIWWR